MAGRLIGVGNAVVDVVAAVSTLPPPGGDVFADSLVVGAGGGCNALVAAARQGVPTLYAGPIGSGPLGDLVRRALAEEGIAVLSGRYRGHDTGVVITLVDADGERTRITGRSAEVTVSPADLARVSPQVGDAVLVSGYGLVHPADAAVLVPWVRALPAGVLVLVDPGPVAPLDAPEALAAVRERVDWCSANAAEAAQLTGRSDPMEAAEALGTAVVRTGADGCVVAAGAGPPVAVPSFAVDVVDTTGAADAHLGVFLAGLLRKMGPLFAARRANAAAAIAVTRRGPAAAPTADELEAFLEAR